MEAKRLQVWAWRSKPHSGILSRRAGDSPSWGGLSALLPPPGHRALPFSRHTISPPSSLSLTHFPYWVWQAAGCPVGTTLSLPSPTSRAPSHTSGLLVERRRVTAKLWQMEGGEDGWRLSTACQGQTRHLLHSRKPAVGTHLPVNPTLLSVFTPSLLRRSLS